MRRFLFNCIAACSVFFLPPYLSIALLAAGIFLFDAYAESIGWAYLIDILYGAPGFFGIQFAYIATVLIAFIFFISFKLKDMLAVYPFAS